MENAPIDDRISFDAPAWYQIRVQGRVMKSWSDRLEGMTVEVEASGGKAPISTLLGVLQDQAALSGVLMTLYELHLPVISVKHLPAQGPDDRQ